MISFLLIICLLTDLRLVGPCMEGALKFKLSEGLDRYETLISSEVYFIEWFPATSSIKVYCMNYVFFKY